ncbi:lysozyme inhibitor LprI family protein [Shimia sp. SDUM112013]|uniref:lysozyme inhibitor LprI family protein n=1 Tax=Shimia sp. SDUM112013 TaxID=3136160 RepID=UPI0032EF3810
MRHIGFANIAWLACLALGSAAQAQNLVFSPTETEACFVTLSDDADPATCIGASANACMAATSDGGTTVGMGGCLEQERAYWDARLNTAYGTVRSAAMALDAEMQEIGSSAPSQAEALKQMQRAWITYRDATCDYERSLWGGGTGGGPATVACHMTLTATQALYLEAQAREDAQ